MPVFITKEGRILLGARIAKSSADLDNIRKEKAIAYHLSGDTWHDNPGFNALEQAEHRKTLELAEFQNILMTAELKQVDPRPIEIVDVGSIVECLQICDRDGSEKKYLFEIVGFGESDPNSKKIAYDSPVGKILMGHRIGESDEEGVFIPAVKSICFYEILALHSDWPSRDAKVNLL